jgi:hypothetical protein
MTDEQIEAVAFAIWKVFARHVRRYGKDEETAWDKRWRNIPERVKQQFRDEAIAAIEVITNGEWMDVAA